MSIGKTAAGRADTLLAIEAIKSRGGRVVFTNGCFDILHLGHIRYLADARALGDTLVIGLNSDRSVRAIKGAERPVFNEDVRAESLLALRSVDYVIVFDEETPLKLILEVAPQILVKGGDWPVEKIVGSKEVLAAGGDVRSLPFLEGFSTTKLIERLRS